MPHVQGNVELGADEGVNQARGNFAGGVRGFALEHHDALALLQKHMGQY